MSNDVYSKIAWPYAVEYGEESRDSADVLVLGGGLAGCFTAIHAAQKGASVIVLEKGATIRSGAGGAGIDHWSFCMSNPCSTISADTMMAFMGMGDPLGVSHHFYIGMREGYDALLDLEKWGVKIRDEDGLFEGAPFRDEKTKHLFAYDYKNKYTIRIFGAKLKPAIRKQMKKLGIKVYDRTMATSLLTEGGKRGGRVIGATAVNTRTGKFSVFSAKATVLSTAKPLRLWEWGAETAGSNSAHDDPNCAGDGTVMAWRAGAELTLLEKSGLTAGALRYPPYGTGNCTNSWHPCNIVDSNGKTIPWVDRDGNIIEDVTKRSLPSEGQNFILGGVMPGPYPVQAPHLIHDLEERIMKGEYKQPFWADLPSMPKHERNAIFGLHIGNEGKTRIPVFQTLVDNGFDPDKDMLMVNVTHPKIAGKAMPVWMAFGEGVTDPCKRDTGFFNCGGVLADWESKTTLEGLFAVGNETAGNDSAMGATGCGRYCGRNAAKYAKGLDLLSPDEGQVASEKNRIYAPIDNEEGYGWKEVQIGLCRVMQDYLGEYKAKEILEAGLWWMDSIRKTELKKTVINNPHELVRWLECDVRLSCGEIIMHSSLKRESSAPSICFKRIDYPSVPDSVDEGFIALKLDEKGEVVSYKKPFFYWLEEGSYEDLYDKYSALEEE